MLLRFRIQPPASGGEERVIEVAPREYRVTLGRRAGSGVPLPYRSVASLHATVRIIDRTFEIVDEGSASGVLVGDQRLAPREVRALKPGDVLRLGEVTVIFEGPTRQQDPTAEGTGTLARRLVSDLFRNVRPAEAPRLVVLDGPATGKTLLLTEPGRAYRLGRSAEVDLALPDEDVSRIHAAVERGWDGVRVRDLGSKNRVKVGGAVAATPHVLRDGDIIQLGNTRLRLDDPEDRYLRALAEEPPILDPSAAGAVIEAPAAGEVNASEPARPPVTVVDGAPARSRGPSLVVLFAAAVLAAAVSAGVWAFLQDAPAPARDRRDATTTTK